MIARVLPGYGRNSLAELLPSVCDAIGVPGFHDVLGIGETTRAAVLLVDGLGLEQLREHADDAPFLSGYSGGDGLTSVFPSTTCAALGSLGTGLPTGGHGLVGASFRLPETGRLLAPLTWGSEPAPRVVQPETTVFERAERAGVAVSVVADRSYRHSGLTGAALRGGEHVGGDGPGERAATMCERARAGSRSLVYGYWGLLDRTAHVHGVASPHYARELSHVDLLARQLFEGMPAGSRLIVTADHGMIDCPVVVDLDSEAAFADQVRLVAGEPRMRHVYTRRGAARDVAARWRELLGDRADVMDRESAVALGLFGEMDPGHVERIGDVLAVAAAGVRLAVPSRDSVVSSLLGQHGGLTHQEMRIPLLNLTIT